MPTQSPLSMVRHQSPKPLQALKRPAACLDIRRPGSPSRPGFGTVVVQADICDGRGYRVASA